MHGEYIKNNNTWQIIIDKDLDSYNIPELHKTIMKCIKEKKIDIVLECSRMSFIDSTGLGALANLMKIVKEYKGTITIRGLKKHIKKIFKLTGLNTIFNIEGDEDE